MKIQQVKQHGCCVNCKRSQSKEENLKFWEITFGEFTRLSTTIGLCTDCKNRLMYNLMGTSKIN